MTEQRDVIKEYNAQLSKIGSTDNIGKLNQQLKFIQTNLEFYQQAMWLYRCTLFVHHQHHLASFPNYL